LIFITQQITPLFVVLVKKMWKHTKKAECRNIIWHSDDWTAVIKSINNRAVCSSWRGTHPGGQQGVKLNHAPPPLRLVLFLSCGVWLHGVVCLAELCRWEIWLLAGLTNSDRSKFKPKSVYQHSRL